jgi:hypothetical protein
MKPPPSEVRRRANYIFRVVELVAEHRWGGFDQRRWLRRRGVSPRRRLVYRGGRQVQRRRSINERRRLNGEYRFNRMIVSVGGQINGHGSYDFVFIV